MSEISQFPRDGFRNRNDLRNGNFDFNEYERIDQSDSDRTRDEFLEVLEKDKKIKEEYNKSNLFKSRIIGEFKIEIYLKIFSLIDSEINASLILQIILYYNYYYSIMGFFFQFASCCYKVNIYCLKVFISAQLFIIRNIKLF